MDDSPLFARSANISYLKKKGQCYFGEYQ